MTINDQTHPEIIIGLIAGVGTDLKRVIQEFKVKAAPTKYNVIDIHVSDFVNQKVADPKKKHKIIEIEGRIKKMQPI